MTGVTVSFSIVVAVTERLDRFLADQLSLSRTQAARLVADKRVAANGKSLRASALLERGTEVTVAFPPEAQVRTYAPAHADLSFVYEDDDLAVLDKPAGLVVHPGPGHWDDTLVNVLVGRGMDLSEGAARAVRESCTGWIVTRRGSCCSPRPISRTGGSPAPSNAARSGGSMRR